MKDTNLIKTVGALALAIGLSALTATAGQGNQGNPGVVPPQAHPNDMTYGQWAAAWWHWALSIPASTTQ